MRTDSAPPAGTEDHVALVSEEVGPDSFMKKQVQDFGASLEAAQRGAHPDEVSAALSDDMDEEFSEQSTLAQLEQDNEQLASNDEPDLGETPSTTSVPAADASLAKAKDEEELAKLDKQAQAAKKLEKKNEHLFDKMGKDLQAKADMKKQVKEVQDAAKKALKATGSDKQSLGESKFDFDAFEAKYGKKSSSSSSKSTYSSPKKSKSTYSSSSFSSTKATTSTSSYTPSETAKAESRETDEKIKKLDAMEAKLKASETKTEKNMDDVEHAYVKQKKTSDEMKKEMKEFKAKAKLASSLADKDDPSTELGESAAEMDEEIENLQELQQGVTQKLDKDEIDSMVKRSNHVIANFANDALDVIDQIH